jgi:osmoprotectant transport system permease protein
VSVAATRATPRAFARRNPVLLFLALLAASALFLPGFVTLAANRLVSGNPIALLAAAGAPLTGAVAMLVLFLLLAAILPLRTSLHCASAAAAFALLLLGLEAAGFAAAKLVPQAGPAARVSFGASFWVLEGAAALAIGDALQRLRAGPAVRLLAVLAVAAALLLLAASGDLDALSIAHEYRTHRALFWAALWRHLLLVAGSVGPALLIGFPLGVLAARRPRARGPLFAVLNLLQTIPSIALFGFLIAPLSALARAAPPLAALGIAGIGLAPALIALTLYALLPIVRNTASGLLCVDPAVIEAARGTGLSKRQLLCQVELPLALPVLLAGLRIVTVQAVGLAVVAALIGAGGLGSFVFEGLGEYAVDLVLLGALPSIVLALFADFALGALSAGGKGR